MKQSHIKSIIYNIVLLGLFLCGLFLFLLRFSLAAILILLQDDVKFASDYWLDQPLIVYAGFIVTYIIHWLLLAWGHKHSLVSYHTLRVYFAFDILVLCGTVLCFCVMLLSVLSVLIVESLYNELFIDILTVFLLISPQFIICSVLFSLRIHFLRKFKKTGKKTD